MFGIIQTLVCHIDNLDIVAEFLKPNGPLIGAVTVRRVLEAYGAVFAHIGTVLGIWLCSDVEIRKYRDIGNCSY